MSALAALLKVALALLMVVQNNPALPDSQKQAAIATAMQAIQLATQSGLTVSTDTNTTPTNPPVSVNSCPALSPLPPGWCRGGIIKAQGLDKNGCQLLPKCNLDLPTNPPIPNGCNFFIAPSCEDGEKLVFTPGTCDYTCVSTPQMACTQETKICTDGKTAVGRDAENNCEFRACPTTTICPTPSSVCPDGNNPRPKAAGDPNTCDYVCPTKTQIACSLAMPFCPNGYNPTTNGSDGCPIYSCKDKSGCVPRPTCLDGNPRCMITEPIGGWCPPTTRPEPPVCPARMTPYCPNGYNTTVDSNGCRVDSCKLPTDCPVTNLYCPNGYDTTYGSNGCPVNTCKNKPECTPRPDCLDATTGTQCRLPEPAGGWCPTKPKPICPAMMTPYCPNGYDVNMNGDGCKIYSCKQAPKPPICEHAAPPSGCRYVDGPNIATNPCDQILSCNLDRPICPAMMTPDCPNGYITTKNSAGCEISTCRQVGIQVSCDYPAPPAGCSYVKDPNSTSTTACDSVLVCTNSFGASVGR